MLTLRDEIIAAAYKWLGTPFAHYQCCLGAGVDCAHLVIGVGKMVHILPQDLTVPYYSPQWFLHGKTDLLVRTMQEHAFIEKPAEARLPGDVLVFQLAMNECHVGIHLPDERIIHARNGKITRKVVIAHLSPLWKHSCLRRCFAYPGVEN